MCVSRVAFNISLILVGTVAILWGRRWLPKRLARIRGQLADPSQRARVTRVMESRLTKSAVVGAQLVGLIFVCWGAARVFAG